MPLFMLCLKLLQYPLVTKDFREILIVLDSGSLLLDTSSLTGKFAQIVKFRTTYLTTLVHLDRIDIG